MLTATHFESYMVSWQSPVHFILYVDDLARSRPEETNHSLHADDLAMWFSSPNPLKAAQTVQKALDHLKEWSLKWHLPVNPAKC